MIATWLTSVLESAGYRTCLARDLGQARERLQAQRFDLWLCDLHLPDGLATELLAWPRRAPAIALTADLDADRELALQQAGFAAVLGKPCSPASLLATLAGLVPATAGAGAATAPADATRPGLDAAVLDDALALRSCGDAATVRALRELLAGELRALEARLGSPWRHGDRERIGDELHRLAAAARWCGARALARHLDWLRPALAGADDPESLRAGLLAQLERLRVAIAAWLRANDP